MVSIEMGREISDNRFRKYIHTHSHFPLRKKNEARGKNPLPLPINLSPSLKFCIGPVMKLDSMAKESSHYQSSVLRARPNFLSKSLFFFFFFFFFYSSLTMSVCVACVIAGRGIEAFLLTQCVPTLRNTVACRV